MTREESKVKTFDILRFVADNAGLSTFEAIEKAYHMGVSEQEHILDKIKAEIIKYEGDCRLSVDEYPSCKQCTDNVFESIYGIIDKYKGESEK